MEMKSYILIAAAVLTICASSCKNGESGATAAQNEKTMTNEAYQPVVLSDKTEKDGSRTLSVQPTRTCSSRIDVTVKNGVILSCKFTNGCSGNTQGISSLIVGMKIQDAVDRLYGIDCGGRGTSCPDQLAKALKLLL